VPMFDIPIGLWVEGFVDALRDKLSLLFEGMADVTLMLVNLIYLVFAIPHPFVTMAALAAVAFMATKQWATCAATVLGFLVVYGTQMWTAMLESLAVVLLASLIAIAVGIPTGIASARSDRVKRLIRPVLDFMQTLPVFVYLLPAVFFFGIGVVPGVVATTVFAIPPAVRLTDLGIRQVDPEMVEAAQAFGSRPNQVLTEVQLPLAMPSIMAGVNQVIMLALSMVVIAGMVGGGGLGSVVVQAVTQLDIGKGFEGGLAVVILAIYLDRVTAGFGGREGSLVRRRARKAKSARASDPPPRALEGSPA
jgi:glycine betaine/proline transport system permease protein